MFCNFLFLHGKGRQIFGSVLLDIHLQDKFSSVCMQLSGFKKLTSIPAVSLMSLPTNVAQLSAVSMLLKCCGFNLKCIWCIQPAASWSAEMKYRFLISLQRCICPFTLVHLWKLYYPHFYCSEIWYTCQHNMDQSECEPVWILSGNI